MALIIEPLSLTVFAFDLLEDESVSHDVEWTSFPVESGLAVSDHAILLPDEVTLKGIVSDHPVSGLVTPRRSMNAYDQLVKLRNKRKLVTVVAGYGVFTDMGIVSLKLRRNADTGKAVQPEVTLRKIRIVQSVSIPVPPEILAPKVIGASSPVSVPRVDPWDGTLDPTQMQVSDTGAYSMQDLGGATSNQFPRPGAEVWFFDNYNPS